MGGTNSEGERVMNISSKGNQQGEIALINVPKNSEGKNSTVPLNNRQTLLIQQLPNFCCCQSSYLTFQEVVTY